MTRGVYPRPPSRAKRKIIRTLRPGEPLPPGEPYRYPQQGYVRLRWKVGVGEYVEVREHRAVVVVDAGQHVHHKNRRRADNRPENLVPLTPSEHAAIHAEAARKFDRDAASRMYRAGLSTTAIAARLGVHHVTIARGLRDIGITMRPRIRYVVRLDATRVRSLHEAGLRAPAIARVLGSTREIVERHLRDLGLTPHPPGRPPAYVRQLEEALRAA